MALLVLHIACVVATGALNENLPIYRYFTNPSKFQQPCVLAHSAEESHSVFEFLPSVEKCFHATCTCGLRLAFKGIFTDKVCPHCHDALSNETGSSTSSVTQSVSCNADKRPEWDVCTNYMNPAVYRALHFIVYSSYYAGIAIGTSSDEKLSTALHLLRGFDIESEGYSPERFCFENMETDLSLFMKTLCCKRDIAIKTMHLLVEKSSDLMRCNNLLGTNDCTTPEMRREWEYKFSQLTEAVVLNAREVSKELKEMKKLQQTEDSPNLECRILELDSYPGVPEEQNQQLKRLYRVTKQPCFEDFRSAFLHSSKKVQEKHGFLTLFFAKFEQLPIIGHLHHLLKWSRLVSSALTHRISRKDANSKSINDFIIGHLLELNRNQQEVEDLKKLFNNFKESWNEMRPLVNEKLMGKKEQDMPRLTEVDYVAYCLTESDYGFYLLTAIEILVSFQNSVLDAMIFLSSSHQHPALSFFEKDNSSGVMSISIQEVQEKEIISFQWTEDLFTYAQSNLEYGKGQKITYDFERIEMELATEIGFGKCYLKGSLNKFIFAKELFHSCGPLLTEIRLLVTQSPTLPEDVRKGLSMLKEQRIKEAQDLLQHIEVLIFLLKLKLKNFDVDMTLEDLAEKWSPMLPSPFPVNLLPQPRSSIKIKHVAALYEALEDLLADGVIDGLADKFRDDLPSDTKGKLRAMVDEEFDQLKPHNFLKALRRFVFRYLSSGTERYWPEETETLQCCLKEPSLWSPLKPPNLEVFPKEITLEYIFSIVKYLEELEKERKSSIRRPGLRSSVRTTQSSKQAGRRRLTKFSRT